MIYKNKVIIFLIIGYFKIIVKSYKKFYINNNLKLFYKLLKLLKIIKKIFFII